MNWYKFALTIENFSDRNKINENIRDLKEITITLAYLRKYVYQNAVHAKQVISTIANGKKMSTYPEIKKLLLKANDKALDNYKSFAEICDIVLEKIYDEIKKLEKERTEFTNGLSKNKKKD